MTDNVNHPPHYTMHPSGVECIEITEHMNFNLGSAFKYIWRVDAKGSAIENLEKAVWYLKREIARRQAIEDVSEIDGMVFKAEREGNWVPDELPKLQDKVNAAMGHQAVSSQSGWVSHNRCGQITDPVMMLYGPNPHVAHSYGERNSYFCDGYV